jgi:tryptophan synthase alpha chain
VAVGFGVSTPGQVATVGEFADGVVVGSALVRLVEELGGDPDVTHLVNAVEQRVRELTAPLRRQAERRRA